MTRDHLILLCVIRYLAILLVPVRTKSETGTYGLRSVRASVHPSVRPSVRPCVRPDLYLGHPWTDCFETLHIPRTLSATYARAMIS